MLVAIVSQNNLVLVFEGGHRTIIARYVAKWGIALMFLCGTKCQGGVPQPFGKEGIRKLRCAGQNRPQMVKTAIFGLNHPDSELDFSPRKTKMDQPTLSQARAGFHMQALTS